MKKNRPAISFLFGVFTHNVTDDTKDDKIKSINLNSKFILYNDSK